MKHTTSAKRPVAVLLTLLLIVALAAPAAAADNSIQDKINAVSLDGYSVRVWAADERPWATGTNLISTSPDIMAMTVDKSAFQHPAGWQATPLFDTLLLRVLAPDGGGLPNALAVTYEYTLGPSDLGLSAAEDFLTITDKAQHLTDLGFAVLFENERGVTFPVIGVKGAFSWQTVLDEGTARLDINNDWVIRLDINLAIFDADGIKFGIRNMGNILCLDDGLANEDIYDPVWLVTGMTQIAGGGDWVTVAENTDSKSNPHTGR